MPVTPRPATAGDISTVTAAAAAAQADADTAISDAAAAQAAAVAAQGDADTAISDAADAESAALHVAAKGLAYKVYTTNKSVSSPTGIEEDGVSSGQIILLIGQSTASQNGAYKFNGNGVAMTRSNNADSATKLTGAFWLDTNGDLYRMTAPVTTLGTDAVSIALDVEDYEDVPSAHTTAGGDVTSIGSLPGDRVELSIYRNGARLVEGGSDDYTVSGNTATIASGVIVIGDTYYYIARRPVNR